MNVASSLPSLVAALSSTLDRPPIA